MLAKIKFFLGLVLAICCLMVLIVKADAGLMAALAPCLPCLGYMAAKALLDLLILVLAFFSLWLMNFFKINL